MPFGSVDLLLSALSPLSLPQWISLPNEMLNCLGEAFGHFLDLWNNGMMVLGLSRIPFYGRQIFSENIQSFVAALSLFDPPEPYFLVSLHEHLKMQSKSFAAVARRR